MGEYGEPSNGELARGIADLKVMVGGLIGRAEYAAFREGLEYRLAELGRRAEQERLEREAADKELEGRLDRQAQAGAERRMHWRELLIMGALPAAVALLVGLLSLWAATHHGGR